MHSSTARSLHHGDVRDPAAADDASSPRESSMQSAAHRCTSVEKNLSCWSLSTRPSTVGDSRVAHATGSRTGLGEPCGRRSQGPAFTAGVRTPSQLRSSRAYRRPAGLACRARWRLPLRPQSPSLYIHRADRQRTLSAIGWRTTTTMAFIVSMFPAPRLSHSGSDNRASAGNASRAVLGCSAWSAPDSTNLSLVLVDTDISIGVSGQGVDSFFRYAYIVTRAAATLARSDPRDTYRRYSRPHRLRSTFQIWSAVLLVMSARQCAVPRANHRQAASRSVAASAFATR